MFHKSLIVICFKLSQLAIKTMQSHYCPWCTCQLVCLALWWLILTPGHNENWQKVTQKSAYFTDRTFSPIYPLELLREIRRSKGFLLPPLMPSFPPQTPPYPVKQCIVNPCRNNCMHNLNQACVIDGKERLMLSWVWCDVPIPKKKFVRFALNPFMRKIKETIFFFI